MNKRLNAPLIEAEDNLPGLVVKTGWKQLESLKHAVHKT